MRTGLPCNAAPARHGLESSARATELTPSRVWARSALHTSLCLGPDRPWPFRARVPAETAGSPAGARIYSHMHGGGKIREPPRRDRRFGPYPQG